MSYHIFFIVTHAHTHISLYFRVWIWGNGGCLSFRSFFFFFISYHIALFSWGSFLFVLFSQLLISIIWLMVSGCEGGWSVVGRWDGYE